MKIFKPFITATVFVFASAEVAHAIELAEPLLQMVPTGVTVESSVEVPAEQTRSIERKLGGDIQRLTNSIIRVHGRSIQLVAITAKNRSLATAIHTTLSKIKSHPFCLQKGNIIVEFVGQNIDADFALKTAYELGLLEKPDAVRYRVTAELATVDSADYMGCNQLFNYFISLQNGSTQGVAEQIDELSKRFTFGRTLSLRNPALGGALTKYSFLPPAVRQQERDASIGYEFGKLEERQNVPFVTATLEIAVDNTGFLASTVEPNAKLTAPTSFWPADASTVVALAKSITAGKSTNGAKAMAILEWLTPGTNLKYSGQSGSRWGTQKVLEQRFGHCWDYSDCFITLARAAGVPSRQVAGWLYGSSGHVWAEFYREGKGWQQVDPTGGGKLMCGIYHIPYFTSDDGEMPIVYLSIPKIEILE